MRFVLGLTPRFVVPAPGGTLRPPSTVLVFALTKVMELAPPAVNSRLVVGLMITSLGMPPRGIEPIWTPLGLTMARSLLPTLAVYTRPVLGLAVMPIGPL